MKRWWHYLLLGLFAWLLFLFLRLPAHVAYDVTASERQLPVEFSAMRGTLWDGEGVLQYQGKNATNSNWELSPWALLLGRYSASVELMQADGHVSGELSMPVGGGEVALSEVKGSVPMPLLQQYLPMIPIPLQGDV